jgi:hypothetical protein
VAAEHGGHDVGMRASAIARMHEDGGAGEDGGRSWLIRGRLLVRSSADALWGSGGWFGGWSDVLTDARTLSSAGDALRNGRFGGIKRAVPFDATTGPTILGIWGNGPWDKGTDEPGTLEGSPSSDDHSHDACTDTADTPDLPQSEHDICRNLNLASIWSPFESETNLILKPIRFRYSPRICVWISGESAEEKNWAHAIVRPGNGLFDDFDIVAVQREAPTVPDELEFDAEAIGSRIEAGDQPFVGIGGHVFD